MIKENPLSEKSLEFAVKAVKFCTHITRTSHESIITKQLMRSATSIGANICEANYAVSRADFISKMHIAMKEAAESEYWLKLLCKAGYTSEQETLGLIGDCVEIEKILTATLKKAKTGGRTMSSE